MPDLTSPLSRAWRRLSLGPGYEYHRRLIARSRAWSADEARAHADRVRASPAYRAVAPGVRDKDFYRARTPGPLEGLPGLRYPGSTGGTSGTPLSFTHNRLWARQREWAYLHDLWGHVGFRPFDPRVVMTGQFHDTLVKYMGQENSWKVSVNQLRKETVPELLRALRPIGPFFLHVYPSSLATLVEVLGEDTFADLPIRAVLAGSEAFPRGQRQRFEARFGIPVCSFYGHSEWVALARHDPETDRHVFYPTYGLVEFEPVEFEPVKLEPVKLEPGDGGRGLHRIIGTRRAWFSTPFIRYDTDDLVRLDPADADAPWPTATEIVGRNGEFFIDDHGIRRTFTSYLFGIHGDFWTWVRTLQVRQRVAGHLRVEVVPGDDFDLARARAYLADRFRDVELEMVVVEDIPLTPRGKHRYFVQEMDLPDDP